MTDDAYFQDEDQLSEGNLGKALLADNNKDYFDRGGGITGPTSGEVTVEAAQAFIEDTSSEQLYKVYPTAETLVLPVASGNNYVYATFDPATQDSATWEVTDTQGSGLSNPVSLLRAVVDTSAGSVDLRNGDPVGSFESVSAGDLSITDEDYIVGNTDASASYSSGVWGTILATSTQIDATNVYDTANSQFTVTESGQYRAYLSPDINPANAGDRVDYRIQNVTDGSTVVRGSILRPPTGNSQALPMELHAELTAGKTYEAQIRNRDGGIDLDGFGTGQVVIERMVKA